MAEPTADEGTLDTPRRGSSVGRFVIGETIGAGAMGVVVSARDPLLERDVALKLVRGGQSDELGNEGRARLVREARSMAKLSHPNVLTILEAGIEDEQVYLAMERVQGGTLRALLASRPDASWREIVGLYSAAGSGLAAAHKAGLIHRDFKAENVLVDGNRVLVADFGLVGIAREVASHKGDAIDPTTATQRRGHGDPHATIEDRVTLAGMVVGTPAYMAPEQVGGGAIDERSDQFSFCVALYEALYGHLPFHGDTITAYVASMQDDGVRTPARSKVPTWVHGALLRGLSLDPARRFGSMDGLLQQLTIDPETSRFGSRARIVAVVVIISAVVLWALISAFIDYALSYTALAAVDISCLILAILVSLAIGRDIFAVPFNRKILLMGIGTIASSIVLVAGGYLAGIPAAQVAALHLFVTLAFATAGTILFDARLIIPALGYLIAFLAASAMAELFFPATAVAHAITGATLIHVLGGHLDDPT